MKKILVTHKKYGDRYALIDDEDYEYLSKFTWSLKKTSTNEYPRCNIWINGKRTSKQMHKLIFPNYKMIDHINGDGLDNTRKNLREVTKAQNNRNARKASDATRSKYKGVCLDKGSKKNPFRAYITVDYKRINLGQYSTEEKAAEVYNQAAIKYFGEYAKVNEIK